MLANISANLVCKFYIFYGLTCVQDGVIESYVEEMSVLNDMKLKIQDQLR